MTAETFFSVSVTTTLRGRVLGTLKPASPG